jgi:hypothetical protein
MAPKSGLILERVDRAANARGVGVNGGAGASRASRSGTERSDRAQGDLDALQELTLPTRDLDDRESPSIAIN